MNNYNSTERRNAYKEFRDYLSYFLEKNISDWNNSLLKNLEEKNSKKIERLFNRQIRKETDEIKRNLTHKLISLNVEIDIRNKGDIKTMKEFNIEQLKDKKNGLEQQFRYALDEVLPKMFEPFLDVKISK
ncbi:MAG: hypothetical protein ABF697_08965 [Zymomonas mobilis]|uniref:hypothetical protein n=1 Tax=Zymomonas mobilis TaxID=542 RepID=UPI0039E764E2